MKHIDNYNQGYLNIFHNIISPGTGSRSAAPLAQSAERTTFNRVVVGSSPTGGVFHELIF